MAIKTFKTYELHHTNRYINKYICIIRCNMYVCCKVFLLTSFDLFPSCEAPGRLPRRLGRGPLVPHHRRGRGAAAAHPHARAPGALAPKRGCPCGAAEALKLIKLSEDK